MANERLSMRKTREILRLKLELGRSHREVAASLGIGLGTVNMALERARAAGLGWEAVTSLSEEELDRRLTVDPGRPRAIGRSRTWSISTPSFAAPG